ncbi:MAG: PilN domain-containing protein [Verrucomicrobiales bacterium]
MSKKQTEMSLLVPGPLGWELWKQLADGTYQRSNDEGPMVVGEMGGLPGGDLAMFFPVRQVNALPFRAPSTDEDLFEDLAQMHAERLGVRADLMAGELTDTFQVSQEEDSTVLLHVVLRSPGEGDLPVRTPKEFDLSARGFSVGGNAVCVWKELGRWVFSVFQGGTLLYSQPTSSGAESPDDAVVREIHLALGQLNLQGLKLSPDVVHLWGPQGELAEAGALGEAFDVPIEIAHRPDPVMPEPTSRILPADVHAARRAKAKRNQLFALVGAAALIYFGFAAWLGWGLWEATSQRNKLEAQLAPYAEVEAEYNEHLARWSELAQVVEARYNPMETMLNVARSIPRNSGLRLNTADLDFNLKEPRIRLDGAAQSSAPVTTFSLALKRNAKLRWLDWNNGPANKTQKGWQFVFEALPLKP